MIRGRKHHVLVIDDDEAVGKFAALHLRRHHYRVSRAVDGQAGLALAHRDAPDVIVLDHYLPDMSGADVLQSLRGDERTRTLPVIYLTIDGSRSRFRHSMVLGADDFLSKPFKPTELVDAVDAQLRKHFARMIPAMDIKGPDAGDAERLAAKLREVEAQLADAWNARWEALWEARRVKASVDQMVAERTQSLATANDSLKSYGQSLAHELKGPLRGILGFAGLLLEGHGGRLDREGTDLLQRIEQNGKRMSEFVDALLSLGGSPETEIRREPVDLSAMAGEVVAPFAAGAAGNLPDLRIAPGLTAQADPVLARIVLENLFSNAFKYSSRTPRPVIEFSACEPASEAAFFVRDNGAGFDMRSAQRLFQPFQRLHSPAEFDGMGIGLSTVQRIVARHGGRIWCEAAPGQGATFYFTFKRA